MDTNLLFLSGTIVGGVVFTPARNNIPMAMNFTLSSVVSETSDKSGNISLIPVEFSGNIAEEWLDGGNIKLNSGDRVVISGRLGYTSDNKLGMVDVEHAAMVIVPTENNKFINSNN